MAQKPNEPTDTRLQREPTSYKLYRYNGSVLYGAGGLPDRIPYHRIKGSPFWNDEWRWASLHNGSSKLPARLLKLNLATNEIHFLEDGEEYALLDTNIIALIFHGTKDTSTITSVFIREVPNLILLNKKLDDFVQVLNIGDYQILKYVKRQLNCADSFFRTQKRYFFTDHTYYFLRFNERVQRIKKLNKENIFEFLPSAASYSTWIEKNEIDFKKEADVIRFLNHYNAALSNKE